MFDTIEGITTNINSGPADIFDKSAVNTTENIAKRKGKDLVRY